MTLPSISTKVFCGIVLFFYCSLAFCRHPGPYVLILFSPDSFLLVFFFLAIGLARQGGQVECFLYQEAEKDKKFRQQMRDQPFFFCLVVVS